MIPGAMISLWVLRCYITFRHEAVGETHRVLNKSGLAVFYEPVENSKVFDFIQNVFPAGKRGAQWYRPSILERKLWSMYMETLDDRTLTNQELILAGTQFKTVKIRSYGFLIRLVRLIGERYKDALTAIDNVLLAILPPLRRLCQTVLIEYQK